jgi:hypothetical protein
MTEERWYAGVDWASESHHVFLTDGEGRKIGERIFKHGGEGLAEMGSWLLEVSCAADPGQIYIAIEAPHGPVVETLRSTSSPVGGLLILCSTFYGCTMSAALSSTCGARRIAREEVRRRSFLANLGPQNDPRRTVG